MFLWCPVHEREWGRPETGLCLERAPFLGLVPGKLREGALDTLPRREGQPPLLCYVEPVQHRVPAPKCAQLSSWGPTTEQTLSQLPPCRSSEMGPSMIRCWLLHNPGAQTEHKKLPGI